MSYATPEDALEWFEHFGVPLPPGTRPEQTATLVRYLRLATLAVQRHLGARWVLETLDPEQQSALREATIWQAIFAVAQGPELALGVDDGLAGVGPLSFSLRTPARFSPEAAERLAGFGLFLHSGTVEPDPIEDAEPSA